jgi:large subunit ribosomal protein L6
VSRVGKKPIAIPQGVTVKVQGQQVKVSGPKGSLDLNVHPRIKVEVKGQEALVARQSEAKSERALHGLTRALLANAVNGVSQGFTKVLQVYGVGYKAAMDAKGLTLSLGYSHPIVLPKPQGIDFELFEDPVLKVDKSKGYQVNILVKGIDRQLVGEVAATIRRFRRPEPYQGKGIRYLGEQIRRKAGKAAVGSGS